MILYDIIEYHNSKNPPQNKYPEADFSFFQKISLSFYGISVPQYSIIHKGLK